MNRRSWKISLVALAVPLAVVIVLSVGEITPYAQVLGEGCERRLCDGSAGDPGQCHHPPCNGCSGTVYCIIE